MSKDKLILNSRILEMVIKGVDRKIIDKMKREITTLLNNNEYYQEIIDDIKSETEYYWYNETEIAKLEYMISDNESSIRNIYWNMKEDLNSGFIKV